MLTETISTLLTPEFKTLCEKYPLYSQDGLHKEAICIAVFALGKIRWFILEGESTGDDFTLFGIVTGLCEDEYGYLSLNELEAIEIESFGQTFRVRRQDNFIPTPLKNIIHKPLQDFLKRFDD